ncbi:beta-lactamase [Sodalis ligni]|uniref:class C beta-lactamase n=1 Tax=Sodalis ligni TaxID=2697027 RepID=UPI00193FECAA|nr:beta-lactamase [Sodalis ligni]
MNKTMAVPLAALSMLLAATGAQCAATQGPDAYRAEVDRSILPLIKAHNIPGMAVALTVDGRQYFYNYGLASITPQREVTADTLFELGSVSKTLNVTLAAYADAQKKLSLVEKVSHYLPSLKDTSFGELSLINLATHTTGGMPLQAPDQVNTEAKLMDYLRAWHPREKAGQGRSYSNISIGTLGLIAARTMGDSYANLLQKVILPELGMNHTWINVPDEEMKNYAWGYKRDERDNKDEPVRVSAGILSDEAYGVKSTSADMIRFVEANMKQAGEGSDVQKAVIETHRGYFSTALYTQDMLWEQYSWPVALSAVMAGNSNDMTYKVNPVKAITPPKTPQQAVLLNKTGATGGFGAYVAFIPEKKIGIVMLANRNYPNTERARAAWQIFNDIAKQTALSR